MFYVPSAPVYAETSPEVTCSDNVPEISPFSVIITEIMADPLPGVSLPECEFVEIYNRNPFPVALEGWVINTGNRTGILPDVCLDAKSYAVLCSEDDTTALVRYGQVIAVEGMPPVINHEGGITLRDETGKIIHHIAYRESYYSDVRKKEGGWSLEIYDTENPCGEKDNWHESIDISGGTPCRENSVTKSNPDLNGPSLTHASPSGFNSVRLHFSEKTDSSSVIHPDSYFMTGGMMYPERVISEGPAFRTVVLQFSESFRAGVYYKIILNSHVSDCAGNLSGKNETIDFALPENADSADIVFSEVLFNASEKRPEFIELFNRSEKVIDISSLTIRSLDPENLTPKKTLSLKEYPYLLFPGKYAVITKNAALLLNSEKSPALKNIIEVPSMFSLSDNKGILELSSITDIVDKITYTTYMFDYLMTDEDGVSLERTDPDSGSNDPQNWYPASGVTGYASPGMENSQRASEDGLSGMEVINEVFSPDGITCDSNAEIIITCKRPGSKVSLYVFDSDGRTIQIIAENLSAGTKNSFYWNGEDFSGSVCPPGLYIILAVIYDISGRVTSYRNSLTLLRMQ